ncbi:MAG: hypothetical protein LBH98_00695 [Chitinispirillales bacterium]|jgi:hypothetical protein|nr:hypothetical protein [Chitinispirillales bacterium]
MTDEDWKKYLLELPPGEKQRGIEEYMNDSNKNVNKIDILSGILGVEKTNKSVNSFDFGKWLNESDKKPDINPIKEPKSDIRKVSDVENKNREISLYGDKLSPKFHERIIDEIDNRLGIKTDKKLVEYGQNVIDKMNRRNINLRDAIFHNNVDLNLERIKKPKNNIERVVDKGKNIYDNLPVKPKNFKVSKDGFNAEIKGNIPSFRKPPPNDNKR